MKIIYFIDRLDTPGGMERVLTIKANYLVEKKNYNIQIIVKSSELQLPFFKLNNKIKVHYLSLENSSREVHKHKVKSILLKEKPNICVTLMGNEVYFLHSINDGSKKIAEFHNSKQSYIIQAEENKYVFLKKIYRKYIVRKLGRHVKRYDRFVLLTYEDRKDWGDSFNNSIVIQNPITFDVDDRLPDYSLKSVLSVGRISFQKGFEFLIEVWKIVYKEYPDWRLKIVGRRNQLDSLDELIIKEGLQGVVEVFPATPSVRENYYKSSIYISSSRYEGFPMTLLEASSCGLPIVAWKCPTGPAEIVVHDENGLLSDYLNIKQLASNLIELMSDEEKRERFGKQAKQDILKYDIDNIMTKWLELFNKV